MTLEIFKKLEELFDRITRNEKKMEKIEDRVKNLEETK